MINKNNEKINTLGVIANYHKLKLQQQNESEIIYKLNDRLILSNSIRSKLNMIRRKRLNKELKIEKAIKNEFGQLISDLKNSINSFKNLKWKFETKENVYELIQNKINVTKTFINQNPKEIDTLLKSNFNIKLNGTFFEEISKKNNEMLKQILLIRIFNLFSKVTIKRKYENEMSEMYEEIKQLNSELLEQKINFKEIENKNKTKNLNLYYNLSELQIEINKLNKKLEEEKNENIKLIHWKAAHLKDTEILKNKINELKGVDDINIGNLLIKLDSAYTELQEIKKYENEINEILNDDNNKTLKTWEKTQKVKKVTEMEKLKLLNITKNNNETQPNFGLIQNLKTENLNLIEENKKILSKINELESSRNKKSEAMKMLMEQTINQKPPSLRQRQIKLNKIVKPNFHKK